MSEEHSMNFMPRGDRCPPIDSPEYRKLIEPPSHADLRVMSPAARRAYTQFLISMNYLAQSDVGNAESLVNAIDRYVEDCRTAHLQGRRLNLVF